MQKNFSDGPHLLNDWNMKSETCTLKNLLCENKLVKILKTLFLKTFKNVS